MEDYIVRFAIKRSCRAFLLVLMLGTAPLLLRAQAPAPGNTGARRSGLGAAGLRHARPGSAAEEIFTGRAPTSIRPSACFRANRTSAARWFRAAPVTTPARSKYTINSAGYNIWYQRDEFRFLWKKMSGDVSLAADVHVPGPEGLRRPQGGSGDPPESR